MKDASYDYQGLAGGYSNHRKTDERIAKYVFEALGDAETILNVGAGAGSYEPEDKCIIAVEPSSTMRAQRIEKGKSPAINAFGEDLPFDDNAFDAVMAMVTIHHWPDIGKGLQELKRVARKKVVVMSFDPEAFAVFWNSDYFPEMVEAEIRRFPKIDTIIEYFGGNCEIVDIPVPFDCTDGFREAFYGRPEMFLNPDVRKAQSAWALISKELELKCVERLREELESGEWDRKYGQLRNTPFINGCLKLVVANK